MHWGPRKGSYNLIYTNLHLLFLLKDWWINFYYICLSFLSSLSCLLFLSHSGSAQGLRLVLFRVLSWKTQGILWNEWFWTLGATCKLLTSLAPELSLSNLVTYFVHIYFSVLVKTGSKFTEFLTQRVHSLIFLLKGSYVRFGSWENSKPWFTSCEQGLWIFCWQPIWIFTKRTCCSRKMTHFNMPTSRYLQGVFIGISCIFVFSSRFPDVH